MLKAMSKDSAENSNGDAVNKVAGEGKKSEETH